MPQGQENKRRALQPITRSTSSSVTHTPGQRFFPELSRLIDKAQSDAAQHLEEAIVRGERLAQLLQEVRPKSPSI